MVKERLRSGMARETERWYAVPGYVGRYEVSSRGAVRSLDRIDDGGLHRRARQLRPQANVSGRMFVTLRKHNVPTTFCVSALLARIYRVPNPQRWKYVIHRNHDNRDFRRSNLAWASLAEQRMHDGHKFSCPYYGVTRNRHRARGTLCWVAVVCVNKLRHELGYFATPEEAAYAYDTFVRRQRLARPLNGVRKPASNGPAIESLPGERWRPFPEWKGEYEISNRGRVRTVAHRTRTGQRVSPRLRKLAVAPSGKLSVTLKQQRFMVAKAMETAFATYRKSKS